MMDTECALRQVTSADLPFLEKVYASVRAEELALTGWTEEQKAAFVRQQFGAQDFHYRKYYPTAEFYVIERDGLAIGRLYVDRWEREIRIMEISLLPESRSQGVGTRLLRELQAEARATGRKLSIHVEKYNPALALYLRLGFKMIEDKDLFLLLGWRAES